MKRLLNIVSVFIFLIFLQSFTGNNSSPTIYIIGDSTVKNGQGDGDGGLWGWGDFIGQYFDTTKVAIENHALGGTSSRTFLTKELWEPVLSKLKPGDFALMQFGHNDAGNINDDHRARGTIKGVGDESIEIDNILTKKHEIVHSYGWYIQKYIKESKSKGAIPVVMSPIPRNDWKDGKVPRNNKDSYGLWAKQASEREGVLFIDLNDKMATAMEKLGEEKITGTYFYKRDHTHTSAKGAVLSSSLIIEELKKSECLLKNHLLEKPSIKLPPKKNLYIVGNSTVANGNDKIAGWGKNLHVFFDTMRVNVYNKARGGRSSRTFRHEGLWKEIEKQLQPGDFVIIEFGHNDDGYIDKPKFRGSLKGMGDESVEITRPDSSKEIVHTYGWYMKKYIAEAKLKGAEVIVVSQIPRNKWPDAKVERMNYTYGLWSKEAAAIKKGIFLDLNEAVAKKYEEMGAEKVKTFFPGDHTHTNEEGAQLNSLTLAELIKDCKEAKLRDYVLLPVNASKSKNSKIVPIKTTDANLKVYKFDFGNGKTANGYQKVSSQDVYTPEKGFGFKSLSPVQSIEREVTNNLTCDFVTSDSPFYFVLDLPEGNYEIKIGLGDPEGESLTTVKAESRRLMLENVKTKTGQITTKSIWVNLRSPQINKNEKIKRKPREFAFLNWDNKLSLEFNNNRPCVSFVEIKRIEKARTIFLAGNSTVVDQEKEPWASWGQMITAFLKPEIVVANFAESGEALLSFKGEKRLQKVLSLMQKDDYLFIEFAHNDQKPGGAHLEAFTTYKDQLKDFISQARNKGGIPILVTSMHRRKFDKNERIINTLENYPEAARQTALETNTPLIDLNKMSKKFYEALGPEESKKAFVHFLKGTYPGQTVELKDNTHFSTYGAYQLAKCVVEEIRTSDLELKKYLKKNIKKYDPSFPDSFDKFYWPESPAMDLKKPDGN